MESVQARLSEEDRASLEAVAARLASATGASVTLTDAFGYLLRTLPDDAVTAHGGGDTGPLVVQQRFILEDAQMVAIDRLAQALAERKAQLLGGKAEPSRSDAVRFIIRAGCFLTDGVK